MENHRRFKNSPTQQELLTNLLNNGTLECIICTDKITNDEPIWNCQCCFHIIHLRCINNWSLISSTNFSDKTWSCPTCKNRTYGSPKNHCFCGAKSSPLSNSMVVLRSCGKLCRRRKKSSNLQFNKCYHMCAFKCHPGLCPPCTYLLKRNCKCGKFKVFVECGQLTPFFCDEFCEKLPNNKNFNTGNSKNCTQTHISEVDTHGLNPGEIPQSNEMTSPIQLELIDEAGSGNGDQLINGHNYSLLTDEDFHEFYGFDELSLDDDSDNELHYSCSDSDNLDD